MKQMNKKINTYHKKSPKAAIKEHANIHKMSVRKRVTVIRDSMVKFVKSENLSHEKCIAIIQKKPLLHYQGHRRLYKANYQKKNRYYTSSHWHERSYKQCKYNE